MKTSAIFSPIMSIMSTIPSRKKNNFRRRKHPFDRFDWFDPFGRFIRLVLGTETKMVRRVKLTPPPPIPLHEIADGLKKLRCSPSQIETHLDRLKKCRTKPKISHTIDDGQHRTAYAEDDN
jgi:hypothetical protein